MHSPTSSTRRHGVRRVLMRAALTLPAAAAALALAAGVALATPGRHAVSRRAHPRMAQQWPMLSPGQWPMSGQNLNNTHYNTFEHQISPRNVGSLVPKWVLKTAGDVTATPTVFHGTVYVPDQGGKLWAVNARTGHVLWSHEISSYTGQAGDLSRTSPAVYGNDLILGDGYLANSAVTTAHVFAVNRFTGNLVWSTEVDSFPSSIVTAAPVVSNGVVYDSTSSMEEVLALNPSYHCCSFRGSVFALNAQTGKMLWKTYTVPSNNHNQDANLPGYYSGGSVWGSSPVIDQRRGLLYTGTGNFYTTPSGVCTLPGETGCTKPAADAYADSIIALNLHNGHVVWADSTVTSDSWNGTCLVTHATSCGPDWDFSSAANLYTTINPNTGQPEQLLGAGQKSGVYWAVNPSNGNVVWKTQVGPGGIDGGIEWGSSTDGRRIYVAEANSLRVPYTLVAGPDAGQTTTSGFWAALDAATGKILWQTPDPQNTTAIGYVNAADGVAYAGSMLGDMYALDTATGKILWQFASGGSVGSGAAIVGRTVYWGSGYSFSPSACPNGGCGPNNELYAFTPSTGHAHHR